MRLANSIKSAHKESEQTIWQNFLGFLAGFLPFLISSLSKQSIVLS
ncbi:MAG: hypothetical protein ACI8QD_000262 [Cyclobacteriaceae bacterium]|jgi:hypothetical protein